MPRDFSVYPQDIRDFGVDVTILWDVVRNKLPALDRAVEGLLGEQGHL